MPTFSDGLSGMRVERVDVEGKQAAARRDPRYDTPNGLSNNIANNGRQFAISNSDAPEVRYSQIARPVMGWSNICAICWVPQDRCKHRTTEERDPSELYQDDFENMEGWTSQVSKRTFDPDDDPVIDLTLAHED